MDLDDKFSKTSKSSYVYDDVQPFKRKSFSATKNSLHYSTKKTAKKSVYRTLRAISLAILVIVVVVFLFSITFTSKLVTISEEKLYGVVVGEYVTETTASYYSTVCKARGGAGGIYRDDEKYLIFAAVYLSKSDATAVANNLFESGESAVVYEFTLEKTAIRFEDGMRVQLIEVTDVFFDVLSEMLSIVLEYDTDMRNSGDVAVDIVRLSEKTDDVMRAVERLTQASDEDKALTEIKSFLANQKTILSRLSDGVIKSADLKIAYFDLLLINLEFRECFAS